MKLKFLTPLFLSALVTVAATGCDDDNEDRYETHNVRIEAATYLGHLNTFGSNAYVQEGMMLTCDNATTREFHALEHIEGFTYHRGHAYELKIQRTIWGNPPADASGYSDKLLEVLSDTPAPAQREEVILEVSEKLSPLNLDDKPTTLVEAPVTRDNIINLGINIREKGTDKWQTVALNKIGGFQYQPKHKAELRVEKITLDAKGEDTQWQRYQQVMYELKEIISQTLVE